MMLDSFKEVEFHLRVRYKLFITSNSTILAWHNIFNLYRMIDIYNVGVKVQEAGVKSVSDLNDTIE